MQRTSGRSAPSSTGGGWRAVKWPSQRDRNRGRREKAAALARAGERASKKNNNLLLERRLARVKRQSARAWRDNPFVIGSRCGAAGLNRPYRRVEGTRAERGARGSAANPGRSQTVITADVVITHTLHYNTQRVERTYPALLWLLMAMVAMAEKERQRGRGKEKEKEKRERLSCLCLRWVQGD